MHTVLCAILTLLLWPLTAQATPAKPKYLQNLDRAYRSADWVLQCDSSQICRITGVVKKSGRDSTTRAVVVISRGIEKNPRYFVRWAFIDDHGFVLPPPDDTARLYSRGQPKMPPPLPLRLGAAEGDPAYPQYRSSPDHGWRIVEALRRWPRAVLRDRGTLISELPKGNLDKLLRIMDALQQPMSSNLTQTEQSQWLKEYHFTVVRAQRAKVPLPPLTVLQSCKNQPRPNAFEGWDVDPQHLLWIVHCREGAKVFMQKRKDGKCRCLDDYAPPVQFDVRDAAGRIRPVQAASFDEQTSLLQLTIAEDGRWDCGLRLRYGLTEQGGFGVIEDRRIAMCRSIPAAYWPLAWAPTSWKLKD